MNNSWQRPHWFQPLFLLLLISTTHPPLRAQVESTTRLSGGGGVGFSSSLLRADVASATGVSQRGYGMALNGAVVLRRLVQVRSGVGLEFVDDEDPFTQTTQGVSGTQNSASSANIRFAFVSAGLTTPPLALSRGKRPASLTLGVSGGILGLTGNRGIMNCQNCDSEDFDLAGGAFLEFEMGLRWGSPTAGGPNIRFRTFPESADLASTLTIELSVRHWPLREG